MSVHDFTVATADGGSRSLGDYAGKVLLIVNVASKCGLTPQYEGLQALYGDLNNRGLEILGFPCNQFLEQEPGTDAEIQDFCKTTYDVTFPVFSKIEVNGPDTAPLYRYLRTEAPGDFGPHYGFLYDFVAKSFPDRVGTDEIKWNFTKFLVGRDGAVIRRYEPPTTPDEIRPDLDALLA
ncbi:glutathione peroxidase [Frankia sp. CNm7]|uniref:Glutathione peroxidase n=1 Tax=Frankia nepalensis TaxID=1836974 RepID=A0A937UTI3_9ACTN|nr:glutathione peroxidase [Frankia nepalensis]MBL7501885.1 glutathione peroxidase [Frankia nepalensis]MBL7511625.1 glutathione peroxidase [Frankia nepalensis]MBL7523668.1 glutathione peroxidase [Frankia nepalensis]MBL7633617.1 glutathione peroxidase [Frankia nepalensis]